MPEKPFDELTQLGKKRRLYGLAKAALAAYGLDDAHIETEYYGVNATFRVEAHSHT